MAVYPCMDYSLAQLNFGDKKGHENLLFLTQTLDLSVALFKVIL